MMSRSHSQIAKNERYMNSRAFIVKLYSNEHEETVCISPLSLNITGPTILLDPAPWDSIISVSPLARNALYPEPIGTKKVGLRRIKNPPIGTKKVGWRGYEQEMKKRRSFGKAYYTATSEEETFFGITKSWRDFKKYSGEEYLWTLCFKYRSRLTVGRVLTAEFFRETLERLKIFIQFVNYNFQWTTKCFNKEHDDLHSSMITLCNEIIENKEYLLDFAVEKQLATPAFVKSLNIIADGACLFKQKYAEYSSKRIQVLSDILKVDSDVSLNILNFLY